MAIDFQKRLKDAFKKRKDLILYIRYWTLGMDPEKKYWHEEIGMYKYDDINSVRIDRMNGLDETSVLWDTVGDLRVVSTWEAVKIINQLERYVRNRKKELESLSESDGEFISEIYK